MKTKTNILYLLTLGMVGSIGSAMAQSTAVTDPVGYHQITVLGNGGAPFKWSAVSGALVNKSEFAGCADTLTATEITVAGTPLAEVDWSDGLYYLSITDADNDGDNSDGGAWTNVTGNTDNTITLEDDITAFASAGAKFVVRRHSTISDIFGAANEFGLQSGDSLAAADEVSVVTSSGSETLFYQEGGFGADGWIFNGADATNYIINPGQGLQVKRKGADDVVGILAGHVKVEPTIVAVDGAQFNVEQLLFPVGSTLDDSGLQDDSAEFGLITGDNLAAADEVTVFDAAGASSTHFYQVGGFGADGWVSNGAASGATALTEGSAILVKSKDAAGFLWKIPAPTIAP